MSNAWLKNFQLLKEYLDKHNGRYPKSYEVYKGVNLGSWLNGQKIIYNHGVIVENVGKKYYKQRLSFEQIALLNSINFNWETKNYKSRWHKNFDLLKKYIEENDGKYPNFNEVYHNINLGSWVETQRNIFKNGVLQENGSIKYTEQELTKEQIELLESIDFTWENNSVDYIWEKSFALLEQYLIKYNGVYPIKGQVYRSFNIDTWIRLQRRIYINGTYCDNGSIKYKEYTLSQEQINKLNSINFEWFTPKTNYQDRVIDNKAELLRLREFLEYQLHIVLSKNNLNLNVEDTKIIESQLKRILDRKII